MAFTKISDKLNCSRSRTVAFHIFQNYGYDAYYVMSRHVTTLYETMYVYMAHCKTPLTQIVSYNMTLCD